MLAKQFHIDKETICKIITEDLVKKVVCAICSSSLEQQEDRITSSRDFL